MPGPHAAPQLRTDLLEAQDQAELEAAVRERLYRSLAAGKPVIPPLPRVAAELHSLARSPDADLAVVAGLARRDPQLAGTIIGMVCSAPYRPRDGRAITNLDEATALIGRAGLRDIALALTLGKVFRCRPLDGPMRALQRHSFVVANVAAYLCALVDCDPDLGFLAGLFHDVGLQLILAELAELGRSDPHWLEPELLRLPFLGLHQELGAIITGRWNLPVEVVEVARVHHAPEQASPQNRLLAHLVALADEADALPSGELDPGRRARVPLTPRSAREAALTSEQRTEMIQFAESLQRDSNLVALIA
jgi:putative nucleotidyltransferase with HDIG domain